MINEEKEHEDWIRFNCVKVVAENSAPMAVEKLIETATAIEQYVLNRKSADVLGFNPKGAH